MAPAPATPEARFAVEHARSGLQLRALHRPDFLPLSIDWSSAEQRRRIAAGRRQLLGRALGLHRRGELWIIDATAGLGRDGFTLAALGAQVTLIERDARIAALLEDAMARALASADARLREAAGRLTLVHADAADWIAKTPLRADAVHLDPMYPRHDESALPRKSMQMLRELTGDDADADRLLQATLAAGVRRVAVKRPLPAPALAGREPSLAMRGTQARYDIYLTPGAALGEP